MLQEVLEEQGITFRLTLSDMHQIHFVYEQLYDAQRPIQGAYVDRNADGKIDTGDRYRFHKAAPDYTFGLFSTLNYKKFDFTMNWRASLGNYILIM
jgi:iron complex outermembrane receptor protein